MKKSEIKLAKSFMLLYHGFCYFSAPLAILAINADDIGVIGEVGNAEPALTKDFLDFIPKDFMSGLERITVDFTGHGFSLLSSWRSVQIYFTPLA